MSSKSTRGTSTKVWLGLVTMASTLAMTRAFQMRTSSRALMLGQHHAARVSSLSNTLTSRSTRISHSPVFIKPSASAAHPSLMTRFMSETASSESTLSDEQKAELESKIQAKGDVIREMKEKGSSKEELAPHIAELLQLKTQLDPSLAKPKKKGGNTNTNDAKKNNTPTPKEKKQAAEAVDAESDFITPRSENYSKWYNDIIRVCDLAETSPVRGCMVIKPWGMSLWDQIRNDLDARIKEHGAENAYFPLLIPKSFLSKEAEHVDGFAKECAVVTHHRLTVGPDGKGLIADPEAELEDPLIIRPTSETMIWNMFKKWIVSHR